MSRYVFTALSLVSLSFGAILPASNENVPFVPPPDVPKQNASPGFLSLPLRRKPAKPLSKRQSPDPLQNDVSGYSIEITLGTPPQVQWVDLDTGSNELWVNPQCSNSYYPTGCALNGAYTPGSSSTSNNLNVGFSFQYGIGSAAGIYYTDDMTMGGATIIQQQFGDASTSQQMSEGILGIAWGNGIDTNYNNVIDNLKAQGITQSRAFGLGLGSIDLADGSIVFGGIDIMKYSGPLQKLHMIPRFLTPDGYARYWFYMNQVSITPPGAFTPIAITPTTYSQAMFPDSGSTFCQLPPNLFFALLVYFPNGQVNQGSDTYTISCDYRLQTGYIHFTFGGITVHVSYYEFIWFDGYQCWFAAQPSTQFYLLGDSFMRSAYIVYDQDNMNILIAPAANCGSSIIPISTGVNAVPSISGLCAPTYTPPTPAPSSTLVKKSPAPTTSTSNSPGLLSSSSKIIPAKVSSTSPPQKPPLTTSCPSIAASTITQTQTISQTQTITLPASNLSPNIAPSCSPTTVTHLGSASTITQSCSVSTITQLGSASTVTQSCSASTFTQTITQAVNTVTKTQFVTVTSVSIITASVAPVTITSVSTVTSLSTITVAGSVDPITVTVTVNGPTASSTVLT